MMIETQYGLSSSEISISTPDLNNDNSNKQQGVDIAGSHSSSVLDNLQSTAELLAQIINRGWSVIQGLIDGVACTSGVRKLLIRQLVRPMELMTLNLRQA